MPAGQPYSVTPRGVGLPDYSAAKPVGQVPVGPVYTSTDIGELAARLGSIVTFDRRGNVIWFDDFGALNKWELAHWGAGSSIDLTPDFARFGAKSVKMVTGNAIGDAARIRTFQPYPRLSRWGFEIAFTLQSMRDQRVDIQIDTYDGAEHCIWLVKYDRKIDAGGTDTLLVQTAAAMGDEVIATDLNLIPCLYVNYAVFHIAKLVVNPETKRYERFILNNTEYDLSAHAPVCWPGGDSPHLEARLYVFTGVANNATTYADCAIITQNEPANIS